MQEQTGTDSASKKTCLDCGIPIVGFYAVRCKPCSKFGKNNPQWRGLLEKDFCIVCGRKTSPDVRHKTRMCPSCAKRGRLNPRFGKRPKNYNPDTPENIRARRTIEYRLWREAVFARDGWTCQVCEKIGVILNAHHIKPFSEYPELRTTISNGITLCTACHKKAHRRSHK